MKEYTSMQKGTLLSLARKSIEYYLENSTHLDPSDTLKKEFSARCGVFTTLHAHGDLRGCIGYIIGRDPLWKGIVETSVESAVSDPRFLPVKTGQLDSITVELSILTPLKKIDSYKEIELGIHGVLIRRGFNQGVFLPQVAVETGWSLEEFLNHLSSGKAGLPKNSWKDPQTELYTFSAQVFSEEE